METDQPHLRQSEPDDWTVISFCVPRDTVRVFRAASFHLVVRRQKLAPVKYNAGQFEMKRPPYSPVRQTARIKPGGLVTLSPRFIKRTGWKVGNTLYLSVEGGRIFVERIPDEREWRISRLRLRTKTVFQQHSLVMPIRTLGELITLHRGRAKPNGRNRELGTLRQRNSVAPRPVPTPPARKETQGIRINGGVLDMHKRRAKLPLPQL